MNFEKVGSICVVNYIKIIIAPWCLRYTCFRLIFSLAQAEKSATSCRDLWVYFIKYICKGSFFFFPSFFKTLISIYTWYMNKNYCVHILQVKFVGIGQNSSLGQIRFGSVLYHHHIEIVHVCIHYVQKILCCATWNCLNVVQKFLSGGKYLCVCYCLLRVPEISCMCINLYTQWSPLQFYPPRCRGEPSVSVCAREGQRSERKIFQFFTGKENTQHGVIMYIFNSI